MSIAHFNPHDGLPLDELRDRLEAAQARFVELEAERPEDRAFERGFLAGDGAMTTASEQALNALMEEIEAEIAELEAALRGAEADEEERLYGWDDVLSYADWRRDQRR